MSSTQATIPSGFPWAAFRLGRRAAALLAAFALGWALTGCTSTADPAPSMSAGASSSGPSASTAADALTVDITIAGGDVTPNGEKLDVAVGQQVVLNVTSDENDDIHAHTGGDGYELVVRAGEPATGSFTLASAGSFEVESHHLEKVIVILNAR